MSAQARPQSASLDEADIARFEALGEQWWDPAGPMKALHKFNPVRIGYIRDMACAHFERDSGAPLPLRGLRILDIGCGGGLLSEPLARLGAQMVSIDPAPGNVSVAARHAELGGLAIDYRATTAEDLQAAGERFDVVLAMEVVEHVREQAEFIGTACALVREGGLLFTATLNRSLKSFALAIVGAEYVLGWVPKGTHQWEKFVQPDEMRDWMQRGGVPSFDACGVVYDPLRDSWRKSRDMGVNYMMTGRRYVS